MARSVALVVPTLVRRRGMEVLVGGAIQEETISGVAVHGWQKRKAEVQIQKNTLVNTRI